VAQYPLIYRSAEVAVQVLREVQFLHKSYVIIINALATSVIIIRRDCWYYLLFRDAVEISSICKNFKTASSSETPVTPIPLKVLHEPLPQEKIEFASATNDDRLEL